VLFKQLSCSCYHHGVFGLSLLPFVLLVPCFSIFIFLCRVLYIIAWPHILLSVTFVLSVHWFGASDYPVDISFVMINVWHLYLIAHTGVHYDFHITWSNVSFHTTSNSIGATFGAGTVYPFGEPECIPNA
jgi:hypothetical protein